MDQFAIILSEVPLEIQTIIFQFALSERFTFPAYIGFELLPPQYYNPLDTFPRQLAEFVYFIDHNDLLDTILARILEDCELDLQMFICPQSQKLVKFILSKNIRIKKLTIVGNFMVFLEDEDGKSKKMLHDILEKGIPKEVFLSMFPDYQPCEQFFKFATALQFYDFMLSDIFSSDKDIATIFPKLKLLDLQLRHSLTEVMGLLDGIWGEWLGTQWSDMSGRKMILKMPTAYQRNEHMEHISKFIKATNKHQNLIIQLPPLIDNTAIDAIEFVSELAPERQSQYKIGRFCLGYKSKSFEILPRIVSTKSIIIMSTSVTQEVRHFSNFTVRNIDLHDSKVLLSDVPSLRQVSLTLTNSNSTVFDSIPNTVEEVFVTPKNLESMVSIELPLKLKKVGIVSPVNFLNLVQMNLKELAFLRTVELETGVDDDSNSNENYDASGVVQSFIDSLPTRITSLLLTDRYAWYSRQTIMSLEKRMSKHYNFMKPNPLRFLRFTDLKKLVIEFEGDDVLPSFDLFNLATAENHLDLMLEYKQLSGFFNPLLRSLVIRTPESLSMTFKQFWKQYISCLKNLESLTLWRPWCCGKEIADLRDVKFPKKLCFLTLGVIVPKQSSETGFILIGQLPSHLISVHFTSAPYNRSVCGYYCVVKVDESRCVTKKTIEKKLSIVPFRSTITSVLINQSHFELNEPPVNHISVMSQSHKESFNEVEKFAKLVSSLHPEVRPIIYHYALKERFTFPPFRESKELDQDLDIFPRMLSEFLDLLGCNSVLDTALEAVLEDSELDLQMFMYPQSEKFVQFILSNNIRIKKLKIVNVHSVLLKQNSVKKLLLEFLEKGRQKEVAVHFLMDMEDHEEVFKYLKFATSFYISDGGIMLTTLANTDISKHFPKLRYFEIELEHSHVLFGEELLLGKDGKWVKWLNTGPDDYQSREINIRLTSDWCRDDGMASMRELIKALERHKNLTGEFNYLDDGQWMEAVEFLLRQPQRLQQKYKIQLRLSNTYPMQR
ncbi:unnamed protein product [Ambrosiozyma monospora]|uniref:Unnamed protein product n=1 Tax=Ambrosiozyma monospora TaxID=43982 RepID=A0A9W6YYJ7_AMBMO|nr:unnamed protein product [Ambrosiozyma monospora]